MSSPIKLYSHNRGPNGWKVSIIMEELGLGYETILLDFMKGEHKQEPHTKLNPNGRIPTIVDGDTTLWESGAIITYLTDKYDEEHKISAANAEEKYQILQWLFFQASGQGPYFGQAAWFGNYHSEKIPSAIERYTKEIKRVWSVLESVLSKQEWLVGGRCTSADLSFYMWDNTAHELLKMADMKEFPSVEKWYRAMGERPSVKKILAARTEATK